jgi:hypothetical protein
MALGLGNIFVDGGFGTRFAPGVNEIPVHCLIVRCAFVFENQSALSESELTSAIEMLRSIIPDEELELLAPTGPATVYTTTLTLWMLILQRLGKGTSLNTVVKDVLSNSRQLLPDNRRVRENTLSEKSGAYSDARKRLPLDVVEYFAKRVCDSFIQQTPSWFDDLRAFIIDGTTMTLSPTSELREAFPPAINQYGETVWPVMLMLVAHELQSGAALPPELGAMYGDGNTSEAKLAANQLKWIPSAKDRKTNPDLRDDAFVEVFLHEVELDNGETLFLVTTLGISAEQAAEFYSRRYDVEHDIRDIKVSMSLETLRCRSEVMVKKELLTSVVAYNLVVQFRRQAAEVAKLPPRRLSFKGVWDTFRSFLLNQPPCSTPEWQDRYANALRIASRDKLPNRPGRTFPRKTHPRRPKSTKFMKSQTQNNEPNIVQKPK